MLMTCADGGKVFRSWKNPGIFRAQNFDGRPSEQSDWVNLWPWWGK